MAWNELVGQRQRRSRIYQDSTNPSKHSLNATLATLHHESVLGSGVFDAEVDLAPVHITAGGNDVWRITQNGWHYALGHPNDKSTDGWVGFGGRQGSHWLKFRLLRAGYMHWPTRAWQDVGSAPTYDRANLSHEGRTLTIGPNDDSIVVESVSTWDSIWTTPGGGNLSVAWRTRGDGLKEEVTINRVAREWIATNRPPATQADQTWFGFVFRVDWSDIPKRIVNGLLSPVDDDESTEGDIELRDAADELLAHLPAGNVYVETEDGREQLPLQTRVWKDGDNHYLLIGVRCSQLNGLPVGDLVFDPTVNEQVDVGGDDGYWSTNDDSITAGSAWNIYVGYKVSWECPDGKAWFTFQDVAIPQGATIDSASLQWCAMESLSNTSVNTEICCADVDSATSPTTVSGADGMDRTSSVVTYDNVPAWSSGSWYTSPSVVGPVQEVISRAGWSTGNDLLVFWEDDGSTASDGTLRRPVPYESDSSKATKLDVEYTEGGGGENPWYAYAQQ